jgi:cellulose synthase/poly-beta-1,6-N-acetylglucosamine synthase-like glycosyltransferase
MKISLLVPCYNEEVALEKTIQSCLNQTRKFDELIFIDDSSKDRTPEILARYAGQITTRRTLQNTGNKSSAQEFGLQFVTGDIMVMTDGDTVLDPGFVKEIVADFADPDVFAVGGYVKSLKYNWLTRCRALDYTLGQNIHKLAQSYLGFILVIPGAAGAFRTNVFRQYLTFDHDTVAEDLDFTYKMHEGNYKILYNRKAVVYTQDPATLHSYINQMRRWYGGGWQNLLKHRSILLSRPIRTLELSLLYIEGLVFSILLFLVPLLNVYFVLAMILPALLVAFLFAVAAAAKERRADLLLTPIPYLFLMYVNSYVFIEQFVKVIILRKKNLTWFKPERIKL